MGKSKQTITTYPVPLKITPGSVTEVFVFAIPSLFPVAQVAILVELHVLSQICPSWQYCVLLCSLTTIHIYLEFIGKQVEHYTTVLRYCFHAVSPRSLGDLHGWARTNTFSLVGVNTYLLPGRDRVRVSTHNHYRFLHLQPLLRRHVAIR